MNNILKSKIRNLAKTLAYSGLRIAPDYMLEKAAYGDMWSRIRYLRNSGFNPKQIVDVGAYDGLWSERATSVFPHANILMIEPLESKSEKLRDLEAKKGNMKFYQGLVMDKPGVNVVFHQSETGSSIYYNDDLLKTDTKLRSTTLDIILAEIGIEKVDLLKIDIQGAELDALIGGEKALKSTDFIVLELSTNDNYKNAPHATDIICFLRERDFLLYDVADIKRYHRGEKIHQFDGIFVHSDFKIT